MRRAGAWFPGKGRESFDKTWEAANALNALNLTRPGCSWGWPRSHLGGTSLALFTALRLSVPLVERYEFRSSAHDLGLEFCLEFSCVMAGGPLNLHSDITSAIL